MGFIYSIEKDGLVNSCPNRLGKMAGFLRKNKSNGIVQYNYGNNEDCPVYSQPLYVKPNGFIADWESSEARRKLAYKDAIAMLLECVNDGTVTQSEGKAKWLELKLHYGMM